MHPFPEPRRVGAVVCGQKRVSLYRMQLPEARFGPLLRRGLSTDQRSWLRGYGLGLGAEGLRTTNPASPRRRNHVECVSGAGEPSKQQGPGSQGQPSLALPYGERRAWGEGSFRCFPEPRRVGAVVFCLKRVSLCRMQLPEARFGSPLRWGLGTERLSWLRGHGWGLGAEGLLAPNPAYPRRRSRGEWVSGTGDTQQTAGPRDPGAAEPRFALWRAEGRGRKRIALLS